MINNWEEIDFTIFDKIQNSVTAAEFAAEFLKICEKEPKVKFIPLRSLLKILHGAGLVPFSLSDVENNIFNTLYNF